MKSKQDKIAFTVSVCFHLCLALFLGITFEKTLLVPANTNFDPNKPIIDAVMISNNDLKKPLPTPPVEDIAKKEEEQKRLLEKEQKAKERKQEEEKMALELEKKKEEEKKAEEYQAKLAKEKKIEEEKKEKERIAKLKEEEEKKKKLKKDKEEALAKKKAAEQKAKELIAKREKELNESQSQQQANVRVKQDAITRHAVLIRNKIHQNWRQPIGFDIDGLTCKLSVKLLPTGEVLEAVVVQSSGSLEFDRSAELAVRKASPLPMPQDAAVANEFRQFNFTFRPEAV